MSDHWGEMPKKPPSDSVIPDVTMDIERCMSKFCLDDYEDDSENQRTENLVLPPMDPLMLYAISLHKYANDMTEMIRVAELATEMNAIPPKSPPMPAMPEFNIKHKRNCLNYIPKEFTPFSCGWDVDIPELSGSAVRQILNKCIATMFAHIGFETTHQSVLDILTDVLESFFQKFCHKVVDTIENEEKGNTFGFPNVIEKVLTETGMGGVKGLNDYYQCRVIKYIQVLHARCKELNDHYSTLSIPRDPSSSQQVNQLVRVKEEDDDVVEVDNPELHFIGATADASLLESGLQLLHSLEAEERRMTYTVEGSEEN